MKAIQFKEVGGPDVMRIAEVPTPEPRPGMIRMKVHSVGVNFADTFFRQGTYLVRPKLPDTPGMEAAGVIDAVGPNVEGLKPGMRVAAVGLKKDHAGARLGRRDFRNPHHVRSANFTELNCFHGSISSQRRAARFGRARRRAKLLFR